jgi:hypothetical protein
MVQALFGKQSKLTYAEYLEHECISSIKHDFVNSQMFAIAISDIYEDVRL